MTARKKSKYFTLEEILSLELIHSPNINNDGDKIAYVRRRTDWNENCYTDDIKIYDTISRSHFPVTGENDNGSSNPIWSPRGDQLAYLSKTGKDKEKKSQIFVIDMKSLKKVQISHAKDGVKSYRWSANGKGFYYLTESAESKKSLKDRDEKFGTFKYIGEDNRNNNLFYLSLNKGMKKTNERYNLPKDLRSKKKKKKKKDNDTSDDLAVKITDGKKYHVYSIAPSPDGTKLVYSAAPSPLLEDYDKGNVYLYDIATRETTVLGIKQLSSQICFSPDSKKIIYLREKSWLKNSILEVFDIEKKKAKKIKHGIDENVYPMQWTKKGVFTLHGDKTRRIISLIDNKSKVTPFLSGINKCVNYFHITDNGTDYVSHEKVPDSLSELFFNEEKISDQSAILKNRNLPQKQMISWKSSDGTEIEGVLSLPVNFDPKHKYPLLVIIHGGPTGTSYPLQFNSSAYPIDTFMEKGFITIEPNYRGSAGYGEKFRSLNYRNLGVGDYEDVISGVDYLIKKGFANKNKIGVMGWSQGGYISAYCATYSDRFKAISVGAGISNWETYYYNTDIPRFTKEYLGDLPKDDKDIYLKTSPMTHINKSCTPTLIQHGSIDHRVPVANAYELHRGLKSMGVETKLVIYENMEHWTNKPGVARAISKQNLYWFCYHILGEKIEPFYLGKN